MTDPTTLTGQDGAPYLAVDVQPDVVEGAFTLDVSSLDGPDVLYREQDPGLWENVVCDVLSAQYRRGAAELRGLLTQTEAGTATVLIRDTLRMFDPTANADTIHKGTPLRLRAWGSDSSGEPWEHVLWTGEIDRLEVTYHPDDAPTALITGMDLVGVFVAWESEGWETPPGAGDDLRDRVDRVVTEVGRGVVSLSSDTTYAATLAPTDLARPWDVLCAATTAELGRLWVDRDNQLLIRARGSELSGTVRGTLSDIHGETDSGPHCCVADATIAYGWEAVGNRVFASRRGLEGEDPDTIALVRRDNVPSQARYGVGVITGSDLELQTDGQVAKWAEAVVVSHSRPRVRVEQVQPEPSPDDLESALEAWPAVMATDLGDRWLFRFHPAVGPTIEAAVGVLGIELEATPDRWTVRWTTAPAPTPGSSSPYGWFVLDESQLNGGDVLAPYAVPMG